MNLKILTSDWRGPSPEARRDVVYAVGQVTMAPDWDPRPVCGGGIHYAEKPTDYMPVAPVGGHLVEVEPVGVTVPVGRDKRKSQGVRIVREIVAIPTPDEEPDAGVRRWVAERIPAERLTRLLTPDEEPDVGVRWRVAERIPAERLTRLLTPDEEPDVGVRWRVAWRIPAERLTRLLTPNEEPDADVRWRVAERMEARP